MKSAFYLLLISLYILAITSCGNNTDENRPSPSSGFHLFKPDNFFLSGTYIANENAKYCRTADTLEIKKRKNTATIFDIQRHTHFQCYLNQQKMEGQHRRTKWVGSYDEKNDILYILSGEKRIYIKPKDNKIALYGIDFTKIE